MTNTFEQLAEQLRTLPRLARQAALRNLDITLSHVNESGIRTAPTSTVPPGVNLDRPAIDQGREWPNLLIRLSRCVRVVCEECPSVYPGGPDLSVEGRETWVGECGWLLKTMPTWRHEPFCVEWIGTEVAAIHRKLGGKLERRLPDGTRRCSVCGEELLLRTTRTLAWAECDKCARVVAMGEVVPTVEQQQQTMALARAILGLGESA